jgi:hypothetical protein
MSDYAPVHPVDALSDLDKYRIYYFRVVELAVELGLLDRDPDSEIGYFAFSRYYEDGRITLRTLKEDTRLFEQEYPKATELRVARRNEQVSEAIQSYLTSGIEEKAQDLICVGASHRVWPTGTSFTLTYPWDLAGNGQKVRFRSDLNEFMKRRIVAMLRQEGKLRNINLFW